MGQTTRTLEHDVDAAVHEVGDKAEQATAQLQNAAGKAKHAVREKTEDAKERLQEVGHEGQQYLKDHDLAEMPRDGANAIRRNPVKALIIGIGLGIILSWAARR